MGGRCGSGSGAAAENARAANLASGLAGGKNPLAASPSKHALREGRKNSGRFNLGRSRGKDSDNDGGAGSTAATAVAERDAAAAAAAAAAVAERAAARRERQASATRLQWPLSAEIERWRAEAFPCAFARRLIGLFRAADPREREVLTLPAYD